MDWLETFKKGRPVCISLYKVNKIISYSLAYSVPNPALSHPLKGVWILAFFFIELKMEGDDFGILI